MTYSINQKSIQKLYENRQKFILIGLTGRTGSGCTSAAKILSSSFLKINLPSPCSCQTNEDRKYKIIYKFSKEKWIKFHLIQVRDIITSFIIENEYSEFIEYLSSIYKEENVFSEIKNELDLNIKHEYGSIYSIRKRLTKNRESLKSKSENYQNDVKSLRKELHNFYFNLLPSFSRKLKSILNSVKGNAYVSVYQYIGNNIRSSGKAFDSSFTSDYIYRISERINRVIKILRRFARDNNEEVFVVIDTIRNPFEALFFRERYSAFYLISVNVNNKHRIERLKSKYDLSDSEVAEIDKEWDKKLIGCDIFYAQDIHKCVELSDIHINNPQISNDDLSTLKIQLVWYVSLIMQPGLVTPTAEERCMQVAYTAKLNSACISRQVGAAITGPDFSIKSVGWNNTAEGQPPCLLRNVFELLNNEDPSAYSDYEKNNKKFRNKLKNIYQKYCNEDYLAGKNISFCFKNIQNSIDKEKNQVHTRSLHAEENAFLQIVKYGGSGIQGGFLFTTASPCELCSKKAYQIGIIKIYYIDPYPGIAEDHILNCGHNRPQLILFHGAIGRAYNQLFEPILPYKDELSLIMG